MKHLFDVSLQQNDFLKHFGFTWRETTFISLSLRCSASIEKALRETKYVWMFALEKVDVNFMDVQVFSQSLLV